MAWYIRALRTNSSCGSRTARGFVLSGYPHLEEAYWFGESVLPKLRAQGLWKHPFGRPAGPSTQVPFAAAGR